MAGWWLWNYYMQSPWTRDGKIRAEQVSITPQVSGSISALLVKDNQFVHAGDVLFRIDETPFHIAVLNAQAQLAKAQSDLAKANNEAQRRRHLSRNYISAEDLDTANINVKAMQASLKVAEATLKQAEWQLTQTVVKAPVDGWITSLSTRVGDYATTGQPVFATIYISYVPNIKMVESKSLKLYLFSFRNHGDFHEDCMNIIMKDLIKLMDPKYIEVWGKFTPRGGLSIDPYCNYGKPGTKWEDVAWYRLSRHDMNPEKIDNR